MKPPREPAGVVTFSDAELRVLGEMIASGPGGVAPVQLVSEAKVSSGTASKVLDAFVRRGIATPVEKLGQRRTVLDSTHPMFALVCHQVFLAFGITWNDRADDSDVADLNPPFAVEDIWVQHLMPEQLLAGHGRRGPVLEVPLPPAPDLLTARAFHHRIGPLSARCHAPWGAYQRTYARWHDERDRDKIHEVLHLGWGLHQAGNVLRRGVRRSPTDTHDPTTEPVPALEWIHATYAVRAEAQMLAACALRAAEQEDLARERFDLMRKLHGAELDPRADPDEVTDMITRRREIEQQIGLRPWAGRLEIDDEGRSGERLLYAELAWTYEQVMALLSPMWASECVVAWREAHPDVERDFPTLELELS